MLKVMSAVDVRKVLFEIRCAIKLANLKDAQNGFLGTDAHKVRGKYWMHATSARQAEGL